MSYTFVAQPHLGGQLDRSTPPLDRFTSGHSYLSVLQPRPDARKRAPGVEHRPIPSELSYMFAPPSRLAAPRDAPNGAQGRFASGLSYTFAPHGRSAGGDVMVAAAPLSSSDRSAVPEHASDSSDAGLWALAATVCRQSVQQPASEVDRTHPCPSIEHLPPAYSP